MNTTHVNIKAGKRYSKDVSGVFQVLVPFEESDKTKRDGYIKVLNDKTNKPMRVQVFEEDIEYVSAAATIDKDAVSQDIMDRFTTMDTLTNGVIDNNIRALTITGAPGIGKTYGMLKTLKAAKKEGRINKFTKLSGYCTPISLFIQMWNHQNEGDILLLDDIDPFDDMKGLQILKAALDTSGDREISWESRSSYLSENGVDRNFEFKGTIIFITNMDFDKAIEKGSKMSPHFNALIDRCVYLDLGIHTNEEVMIRIEQVVKGSSLMDNLGVGEYKDEIMEWLEENYMKLRSVSIRSIVRLAEYIRTSPNNWQMIAKSTMIKRDR